MARIETLPILTYRPPAEGFAWRIGDRFFFDFEDLVAALRQETARRGEAGLEAVEVWELAGPDDHAVALEGYLRRILGRLASDPELSARVFALDPVHVARFERREGRPVFKLCDRRGLDASHALLEGLHRAATAFVRDVGPHLPEPRRHVANLSLPAEGLAALLARFEEGEDPPQTGPQATE